jgi:hypothetical protein
VVGVGDLREQLRLRPLIGPLDDDAHGLGLPLAVPGPRQQRLVDAVAGDELLRLRGERLGLRVRIGRLGLRQERPDLRVHAGGLGPAEAVDDRGAARQRLDPGDAGESVEHVERFQERAPPHDPVPAAQVLRGLGDARGLDVPGQLLAVDDPAVAELCFGVLRELAAHEDGPGAEGLGAARLPEGARHLPGHPTVLPGELDRFGAEHGERVGEERRPGLVAGHAFEVGGRVDPVQALALGLLEEGEDGVAGAGVGRQALQVVLRRADRARARPGLSPIASAH